MSPSPQVLLPCPSSSPPYLPPSLLSHYAPFSSILTLFLPVCDSQISPFSQRTRRYTFVSRSGTSFHRLPPHFPRVAAPHLPSTPSSGSSSFSPDGLSLRLSTDQQGAQFVAFPDEYVEVASAL
eukprot:CAMPEP_0197558684 /NCGR_PEP_ID=MMETSP1320-20131121/19744_1 /TAXON_ID=91990 /ORGANISM="Bolidomonas sp., Strain RCC2347" /LENGTH=123 /DNA_ID=CAMNT_0043120019 /DNA_START=142 /DNA_END=510 /DNA_ORIENTATION=-